MTETQALVSFGIACLIAAVVGGGLTAAGVNIPQLESRTRQVMLGLLGATLLTSGVVLSQRGPLPQPTADPRPQPTRTQAPGQDPTEAATAAAIRSPATNVGSDLVAWRRASEAICASATRAASQTSDPVAWAQVYLGAAVDLRSIGTPSDMTSQADDWHARVDEVTAMWYQVALARVNGDANANYELSLRSSEAARRANQLAAILGMPVACYFAESV